MGRRTIHTCPLNIQQMSRTLIDHFIATRASERRLFPAVCLSQNYVEQCALPSVRPSVIVGSPNQTNDRIEARKS